MLSSLKKLTAVCLAQALLFTGLPVGSGWASDVPCSYLQQQTPIAKGKVRLFRTTLEWGMGGKALLRRTEQMNRLPNKWRQYLPKTLPQSAHVSMVADGILLELTRDSKLVYYFGRTILSPKDVHRIERIGLGDGVFMQVIPRRILSDIPGYNVFRPSQPKAITSQLLGDGFSDPQSLVRILTRQHVERYVDRLDQHTFGYALHKLMLSSTPVDTQVLITTPLSKAHLMLMTELDFEVGLLRMRGTNQWVMIKGMEERVKKGRGLWEKSFLFDIFIHNHPGHLVSAPSKRDVMGSIFDVNTSEWILARNGMLFMDTDNIHFKPEYYRETAAHRLGVDEPEEVLELTTRELKKDSFVDSLDPKWAHIRKHWRRHGIDLEFRPWEAQGELKEFSIEELDRKPGQTLDVTMHSPNDRVRMRSLEQLFKLARQGEAIPFLYGFYQDTNQSVQRVVADYIRIHFQSHSNDAIAVLREFTQSPFRAIQALAFVSLFRHSALDGQIVDDFKRWLELNHFWFPEDLSSSEDTIRTIATRTGYLWQKAAASGTLYNASLSFLGVAVILELEQGPEIIQNYLQDNMHNSEQVRMVFRALSFTETGSTILLEYLLNHPEIDSDLKIDGLMFLEPGFVSNDFRDRSDVARIFASIPFNYLHDLFANLSLEHSEVISALMVRALGDESDDPRVKIMVQAWEAGSTQSPLPGFSLGYAARSYTGLFQREFDSVSSLPDQIQLKGDGLKRSRSADTMVADIIGDGQTIDHRQQSTAISYQPSTVSLPLTIDEQRATNNQSDNNPAGDGADKRFLVDRMDVIRQRLAELSPGDKGISLARRQFEYLHRDELRAAEHRVWQSIASLGSVEEIRRMPLGELADRLGMIRLPYRPFMHIEPDPLVYIPLKDFSDLQRRREKRTAHEKELYDYEPTEQKNWLISYPEVHGPGIYWMPELIDLDRQEGRIHGKHHLFHELLEESFLGAGLDDTTMTHSKIFDSGHTNFEVLRGELRFAALMGEAAFEEALEFRLLNLEEYLNEGVDGLRWITYLHNLFELVQTADFEAYRELAEVQWARAKSASPAGDGAGHPREFLSEIISQDLKELKRLLRQDTSTVRSELYDFSVLTIKGYLKAALALFNAFDSQFDYLIADHHRLGPLHREMTGNIGEMLEMLEDEDPHRLFVRGSELEHSLYRLLVSRHDFLRSFPSITTDRRVSDPGLQNLLFYLDVLKTASFTIQASVAFMHDRMSYSKRRDSFDYLDISVAVEEMLSHNKITGYAHDFSKGHLLPRLRLEGAIEEPKLWVSWNRLFTFVREIIWNALSASDPGGEQISVDIFQRSDHSVVVEISNRGSVLSANVLEEMFLYRYSNAETTSGHPDNLGLGLPNAAVSTLINGGTIEIISGDTFLRWENGMLTVSDLPPGTQPWEGMKVRHVLRVDPSQPLERREPPVIQLMLPFEDARLSSQGDGINPQPEDTSNAWFTRETQSTPELLLGDGAPETPQVFVYASDTLLPALSVPAGTPYLQVLFDPDGETQLFLGENLLILGSDDYAPKGVWDLEVAHQAVQRETGWSLDLLITDQSTPQYINAQGPDHHVAVQMLTEIGTYLIQTPFQRDLQSVEEEVLEEALKAYADKA